MLQADAAARWRNRRARRTLWRVAGIVALALVARCCCRGPRQRLGDPALISLATRMVIYAIAAASLNLILGYGGLVSFGHAAYFGVGAYAVGILYFHFSAGEPFLGFIPGTNQFLMTLPAAVVISAIFALVLGGACRCAPPACNSS